MWRLPGRGWQQRWAALRVKILEMGGYRCVKCGRAGRLERQIDRYVAKIQDRAGPEHAGQVVEAAAAYVATLPASVALAVQRVNCDSNFVPRRQ